MDLKEVKNSIKENIQWIPYKPERTGGQTVGTIYNPQTLYSEDLDVKITIGHYGYTSKNRELCMLLFELTLDELIK